MYEWLQAHEVVIMGVWYGFLAGNVTGLFYMYFTARATIRRLRTRR